ncbi:hypothetical protein BgiMline_011200, partial [Biomphalaria glabrata]
MNVWITAYLEVFIDLAVCTANQMDRVGSTASQRCLPLPPVEHGTYVCSDVNFKHQCQLKCLPNYMIPITQNEQKGASRARMKLSDRGKYTCEDQAGGKVWNPLLLFDCVEAKYPTDVTLYYAMTITEPKRHCEEFAHDVNNSLSKINDNVTSFAACAAVKCRTSFELMCDGKYKLLFDFELMMDLNEDLEYSDINKYTYKVLQQSLSTHFSINIHNNTVVNCPEGTLIQKDLTCRGCSKGYFLDGLDMFCKECPPGFYQDEDLQHYCKPCPPGAPKDLTGLKSIAECFHVDSFVTRTSLLTILAVIFSIVLVAAVLLVYRSQVLLEPDGKTREYYPEPIRQKMETYLGRETVIPEVGTEARKISVMSTGGGDHKDSSVKEDGTPSTVSDSVQHKYQTEDRGRNARMSVAGLAAARLSGTYDPRSRKSIKGKDKLKQEQRKHSEVPPGKYRASVNSKGRYSIDDKHGQRSSSFDRDSNLSLVQRKSINSYRVTGPKD